MLHPIGLHRPNYNAIVIAILFNHGDDHKNTSKLYQAQNYRQIHHKSCKQILE